MGALGESLGTLIWALLVVMGVNQVIQASTNGRRYLQLGSAALIVYFIVRNLAAFSKSRKIKFVQSADQSRSSREFFVKGFLVNLINPNSVGFFASLFASLLLNTHGWSNVALCTLGVFVISILWYRGLGEFADLKPFRHLLTRSEKCTCALLIAIYDYFLVKILGSLGWDV